MPNAPAEGASPPEEGLLSPAFLARAPALALAVLAVALLSISWGRWPDVLVDFGHELYVPWQLAEGKVLGRDIFLGATGSLSPYLNALAFIVLGVSFRSLVILNLALLAGLTWLLFTLLREIGDRLSATIACAFFLAVFAFGQYVGIGNYNYVAPYSHGATHGMLLSLLAIAFAWRHARTRARRDVALASLALGHVLLTKPEFFLACGAALATMALVTLRDAEGARARASLALAMTLPALVPASVSLGLLSLKAGLGVAVRGTFAPWIALASPLTATPFYLSGMGLDDPGGSARRAALWLAGYALLFGLAAVADVRAGMGRARWKAGAAAAALVAAAAWAWLPPSAWTGVARPLPLIAAVGGVGAFVAAWRWPRPCPPPALLRAGLWVFATLLLLKMFLNARFFHYGFVLAMPATLLLVGWLVESAPRALQALGGSGIVFRTVAVTALLVVAGAYVSLASSVYARKTVAVGSGADVFLADARGGFVNGTLHGLAREPAEATLAVLPEGEMVNYLSRRATPTPYLTFLPDAIALWGEPALLEALRSNPPDLVAIVSRDASEHGARLFGRDYATATLAWLQERYDPVGLAGGSPFEPSRFGMLLLRRRATASQPTQPPAAR